MVNRELGKISLRLPTEERGPLAQAPDEYHSQAIQHRLSLRVAAPREREYSGQRNYNRDAIKNAIFTAPENWPAETAKQLEAIIGKYGRGE